MNRFIVVITNRKNLVICLSAILFIIISAFIFAKLDFTKVVETDSSKVKTVLSPANENKLLKEILSSIVPSDNNILFENNNREIGTPNNSLSINTSSPAEVLNKGRTLAYIFAYSDEEYLRPIYSNTWKQSYYQGWLYLPKKIISARHRLFAYVGGAGNIFNIEGELGFYPNISIDNKNYLNLLIYNFDLQNVIQHENQIVVTGTPVKKGVQIISIKMDDVTIHGDEDGKLLVQLCTPNGFEIDFQNVRFATNLEEHEDYGPVEESYSDSSNDISEVNKENLLLRKELTHYISDSSKPIYFQHNGSYQTSNVLNTNIDLDDAIDFSSDIKYTMLYNNHKYLTPVFHPEWKEHYDREWCYIPRKMYINMKRLFVLSSDKDVANDLCGELGFFEKNIVTEDNRVNLLINNFNVTNIKTFEENIIVIGTPSRTGIQVVSIQKNNLTKYREYAVRLVTNDFCELDVDAIKN